MSLQLLSEASIGSRKIARVLKVIFAHSGKTPHHSTIRQWWIRYGVHILQKPLQRAEDWVAIGDLTVDVGQMKCLTIVGVRKGRLEQRGDFTLSHEDVEILGLYPTIKSDHVFVEQALRDAAARVGGSFSEIVIDQGSDVRKGARVFQQFHPDTRVVHDISHKLALLMERHMTGDPRWQRFTESLSRTRSLVQQTELAALMPPSQRSKGRFMDISHIVRWPSRIQKSKATGRLSGISEERYAEYLGWIDGFKNALEGWAFMVDTVETIKGHIRKSGISERSYEHLMSLFEKTAIDKTLEEFVGEAMELVFEEVEKVGEGETLPCSTEVLESVFGKFKEINKGGHGITGNVLGMASFVGPVRSKNSVKEALEGCSVKTGMNWIKQKVGTTVAGLRRQFFSRKNRTNFDGQLQVAATC